MCIFRILLYLFGILVFYCDLISRSVALQFGDWGIEYLTNISEGNGDDMKGTPHFQTHILISWKGGGFCSLYHNAMITTKQKRRFGAFLKVTLLHLYPSFVDGWPGYPLTLSALCVRVLPWLQVVAVKRCGPVEVNWNKHGWIITVSMLDRHVFLAVQHFMFQMKQNIHH